MKSLSILKKTIILVSILICFVILAFFSNIVLEKAIRWYIVKEAKNIIQLEKKGFLSKDFGFAWHNIKETLKMSGLEKEIVKPHINNNTVLGTLTLKAGRKKYYKNNLPALSAIKELNSIKLISNNIQIVDRNNVFIGQIKTTSKRAKIEDLSPILINSIIYAEDKNFWDRELAYEYDSFVRGGIKSIINLFKTFKFRFPKGVSTIHQQVAKYMLSKMDKNGFAFVEKSLNRKLNELKLAQAIKMSFSNEEILEVYLNNCVTTGKSFVGYIDISKGLFHKLPKDLGICENLYLARLLKWNRNIPHKIIKQCKIDLKRIAPAFDWNKAKIDSIKIAMDSVRTFKPKQIDTKHGALIDIANEYWLKLCMQNNIKSDQLEQMDILNPSATIRLNGNLTIKLAIDMRLQNILEELVNKRGYGNDTIITTDIRIGSFGEDIFLNKRPKDTIRNIIKLKKDSIFREPKEDFKVVLKKGSKLITNIRYKKIGKKKYRRSVFNYKRGPQKKTGQYFAYSIMDSETGELLAYYSRDKLGSKLNSLVKNKTPNGSAVAKPILNALALDLGIFSPYTMLTDSIEASNEFAWHRKFIKKHKKFIGLKFLKSSSPKGYNVHNHGKHFEGYDYYFNHLASSNNIIGVETIYRLNSNLYNSKNILKDSSVAFANLFYRLGIPNKYNLNKNKGYITGVNIYSELANIVGASDSIKMGYRTIKIPDDFYSVALGTLEMTLLQQMHLFNSLYNCNIIENPKEEPSLFIKSITISNKELDFDKTLKKVQVFSNYNNIRPSLLGLHKRLTGNKWDRLKSFDNHIDSTNGIENKFKTLKPLSNFAKSGTTDDVIIPYNCDFNSKVKTNYCIWNAIIKINLNDSLENYKDITIACIGEGNKKNTGYRDGKSLHKFLSKALLKKYGQKIDSGYFQNYENFIIENTPDSIKFKNPFHNPNLDSSLLYTIDSLINIETLNSDSINIIEKKFLKGIKISIIEFQKLIIYAKYMGLDASNYAELLNKISNFQNKKDFNNNFKLLKDINIKNKYLKNKINKHYKRIDKELKNI